MRVIIVTVRNCKPWPNRSPFDKTRKCVANILRHNQLRWRKVSNCPWEVSLTGAW